MKLTEKQQRFVDFYCQTANSSEAARQAGYSKRTAGVIGDENLKKPYIRAAIDERLKAMESERVADTQEILAHLTAVVRGEVTEEIVTNSGKKLTAMVGERDKLKAAEMLLKVNGAFREKLAVQVDGADEFVKMLLKVSNDIEQGKCE